MEVTVPKLMGKKMDATLAKWYAETGDTVQEGSRLYDLETNKVATTKTAPATGVFTPLAKPGDGVTYGQIIAEIKTDEDV